MRIRIAVILILVAVLRTAQAQEANLAKPPLFFREDWKESPAETPVTQEHVLNRDLVLELHGPGMNMIKKSHHDTPPDDPYYIWSGQCEGTWAVTLTKRGSLVDLTNGYIRWRTRNFNRILRVVVRLEDGSWLVSSRGTGETPDWHEFTVELSGMGWQKLNIETVSAGDTVEKPDLTRVRSVGFTDLMRGGQSVSSSRLDWIAVFGRETKL